MELTGMQTMSVDVSELDKLIKSVSDDMNARQSRIGQERSAERGVRVLFSAVRTSQAGSHTVSVPTMVPTLQPSPLRAATTVPCPAI